MNLLKIYVGLDILLYHSSCVVPLLQNLFFIQHTLTNSRTSQPFLYKTLTLTLLTLAPLNFFFFFLEHLLTLVPELLPDSQSSANGLSASPHIYIYSAWGECMHMNRAQRLILSSVGSFSVKVAEILYTANVLSCLCRLFGLLPNSPKSW